MTYIWNRAERVPADLMPKRVQDSFNEWIKEEYRQLTFATDVKHRKRIIARIKRQRERFEDAIAPFKA